jgi:hypothetical protein
MYDNATATVHDDRDGTGSAAKILFALSTSATSRASPITDDTGFRHPAPFLSVSARFPGGIRRRPCARLETAAGLGTVIPFVDG